VAYGSAGMLLDRLMRSDSFPMAKVAQVHQIGF
jgi:hypothetical protein